MNDLAFFDIAERTEFSVELYAVVGRALTVATHYEANLRTLVVVLDVKHRRRLLVDTGKLEEEIERLWKRSLNNNVQQLVSLITGPSGNQGPKEVEAETHAWL